MRKEGGYSRRHPADLAPRAAVGCALLSFFLRSLFAFRLSLFRSGHSTSPLRVLAASLIAAAAILSVPASPPSSLLWPIPIREGCTSSFGEYRRTHFHGGVDLRTHQEDGWPCAAVADGKVVRIRREPGGYGRVLYLQLDDGRTAVYGHLTRFSEKLGLEATLKAACERAGSSWPGDVAVEPPVPVRAGETVAYSGDLGVGFPHLHFEIRRGEDLCDPFLEGLPLPDGMTAPWFAGVVFEPQDASGLVDGSFEPLFVPAVKSGGGYRLARSVEVAGRVDLYAVAGDRLGVPGNSTGTPCVEASLDGAQFFKMDLKRISLARFKQAPALFEPGYARGGATAYRLRRLPWLNVDEVEGQGLPGGLSPGPHELSITAANRGGLLATLTGIVTGATTRSDKRLALPGGGYRIEGRDVVPAGLVLRLARGSKEGVTPLAFGFQPVREVLVHEGPGNSVAALVPREQIPREGAPLKIGGTSTGWLAASGPGRILAGGLRLRVPEDAVAVASPEPGGGGARLQVAPYALQAKATVDFPGTAPRPRLGVYGEGGGLFLDNWTGKPVPFLTDGLYCLRTDDAPPQWGKPYETTIPHVNERQLWIPLTDRGSGPNLYSLRMTVDGKPAFADWDPDTHTVRVALDDFSPGRHALSATVADWAGNSSRLSSVPFMTK
jgi:hypothetical protein